MSKNKAFSLLMVSLVLVIFVAVTQAQPDNPIPPSIEERGSLHQLPGSEQSKQAEISSQRVLDVTLLTWSKVVYQTLIDGNWNIYISNDDGSNPVRLTSSGGIDMHPHLNRGGTQVVYASRSGGNYEIFRMNSDGGGQIALTNNDSDDVYPAWSPDGNKIAFQAYRDGQPEIYVMNVDGSGVTRLTNNPAYDGMPIWSPDGMQIAFISNRSGGYRIYLMNANGSNVTLLSNQQSSAYPAWSPDGSQIAYSADNDGDGWLEIWVMNANGTNQRKIHDPYSTRDAWVSGWSPDGRFVTFTDITFIYYSGSWYWTSAYSRGIEATNTWNIITLNNDDTVWHPHWQTLDAIKPSTSISALPQVAPNPIVIRMNGSDSGGSGIRNYDVQVMVGNSGVWTDWQVGAPASYFEYNGTAGETYAFRSRARDFAWNVEDWPPAAEVVTSIETAPPETAVSPLPAFSRYDTNFPVQWGGIDPGGSGILSYDVQFRVNDEPWQSLVSDTYETSASFDPIIANPGDTISFRSRAIDFAGNEEEWPDDPGDTATTFYIWGIRGVSYDNTGTPISGLEANISPTTFTNIADTPDGKYASYTIQESSQYTVTWNRFGLGSLPETGFSSVSDPYFEAFLPPANNIWSHGSFENPNLPSSYSISQESAPVITDTFYYAGSHSLSFGFEEARFFGTPITISQGIGNSYALKTIADNEGGLHVFWLAGGDTDYETNLFFTSRNSIGNWTTPISLAYGYIGDTYSLIIAPDGKIHLSYLYSNSPTTPQHLYYRIRATNGNWQNPESVSNNINDSISEWCFTVDDNSNAHFALADVPETKIFYVQRNASGTWEAPQLLAPIPGDNGHHAKMLIRVDKINQIHLVWVNTIGSEELYDRILHAIKDTNDQWQRIGSIFSRSGMRTYHMNLEVAASGDMHLLWSGNDNGPSSLFHLQYSDAHWSSPFYLGDIANTSSYFPFAKVDNTGNLNVIWVSNYDMYYRQQNVLGIWSSTKLIPRPTDYPQEMAIYNPSLTRKGNHLFLTWVASNAQTTQIYFASKADIMSEWGIPITLVSNLQGYPYAIDLSLAFTSDKSAHITWKNGSEIHTLNSLKASETKNYYFSQTINMPVTLTNPVLSFVYQLHNPIGAELSGIQVTLTDNESQTLLGNLNNHIGKWSIAWFSLDNWAGKDFTITTTLHQEESNAYVRALIDEVSIGTAHPDVWVSGYSNDALPSEKAILNFQYGNRSGVLCNTTTITVTLPNDLTYNSANIEPISSDPLVWEVGELLGNSGPNFLIITTTVASDAIPFSTLSAFIEINTKGELEFLNNYHEVVVYLVNKTYLPTLFKP